MEILDPKWIRVSSILGVMPSKGQDGKWCFPMQILDQEMLQRKADLGTSVHAAIAAHYKDEFIVLSQKEEGYFESYLKWIEIANIEVMESEKRFYYEPMNLTGCVDMIASIYGRSSYSIIDFKCTVAPDHVKWPLQAAFYHFLSMMNGSRPDSKAFFIQLNPNGSLPVVHEYEITKELSQTAISLYNMYIYLTKK